MSHLLQKNHRLLYHRKKIFKTEIDLIFVHPEDHLVFAEVKTMTAFSVMNYRVSAGQKRRLLRVKTLFENLYEWPVELVTAFVEKNDVTVLPWCDD